MSVQLSVLIPAYGYAEGVGRILASFRDDPPGGLEILISDDSCDDQVSELVADFSLHYRGKLQYRRNRPSLGAAANWNSLLEQAAGEYVLLLHHDEFPLGRKFAERAISLLRKTPKVDVFIMVCILSSFTGITVRPHLPNMVRKIVLMYWPTYLFKRNVVGATSCLIARRALYPRFDERLHWLVDVDAYFRLRQATALWCVCLDLKIGSMLGRKDSISASIKHNLKHIDAQERVYLIQKHPLARVWLSPQDYRIQNALEWTAWMTMRFVTRLWYGFFQTIRMVRKIASNLRKVSE